MSHRDPDSLGASDIAVIGAAVHFPGAPDLRSYWRNLRDGIESVQSFDDAHLLAAGVPRAEFEHPHYVKRGIVLEDVDRFDAAFFGFSPKEAAILDPQHRHFLECLWESLEDAAHPPERFPGTIGVFAGCGMSSYFMFNILSNPELVRSVGLFLLRHTGNDKDFLATRAAYLFDLKGPVVNVQTACSTSLVAVHMAVQSLLNGECDLALAGGVTIEIPHGRGYLFQEGEILSPDGHCRAFDARSQGTIFGSGAGMVTLRRLEDALADGDHIYAVIRGTAINNDGSGKVGYLAPSVDGQAAAVAEAISVAGVRADTLSYVECHGTGTAMGDPIEVAALTQAFQQTSKRTQFCGIGSVKTNIGHLDTAAGVASLIKVALALEHETIPPTLNYESPNPAIDFATTPFRVVHARSPWPRGREPRRAGVNSLGVGGTNAHVVVEEAPARPPSVSGGRQNHLLVLSARDPAALDAAGRRLAERLRDEPGPEIADVAWTLFQGRRTFDMRRVVACRDRAEAVKLLESNDPHRVFTHARRGNRAPVAFLLPGGGTQHALMGRDLIASEPEFREHMERGIAALRAREGIDLGPVLIADAGAAGEAERLLERPSLQLPAVFLVEYALARLWMSFGLEPSALLGHSMGENTAACLAGVLSFEDALSLVALRGRLFEKAPAGAMLSVALGAGELSELLGPDLDLAVVNAPEMCVVSGPPPAIDALARTLAERDIDARRVPITTAAHSRLVESILPEFRSFLRGIQLRPPRIPFVSNRTGTWITAEQATDPEYWVGHLRDTVRFGDGVRTLLEDPERILLEVGPGRTLASLARQNAPPRSERVILSSLRHPDEPVSDAAYFLTVLGRLWAAGAAVDPSILWRGQQRRRVPLPAYPFQRQRYWIEPGRTASEASPSASDEPGRIANSHEWFYRPVWKPASADKASEPQGGQTWLVFADRAGVGERVADRLTASGNTVVVVSEGDAYARVSETRYRLAPEHGRSGYDALVRDLVATGKAPSRILHLWMVTADESFRPGSSFFHRNQERGYYSLLFLAQALGAEGAPTPLHIDVVSNGMASVAGEPLLHPDKATLLGPVLVIPHEYPGITCASIDLALPHTNSRGLRRRASASAVEEAVSALEAEIAKARGNGVVAWRANRRYEQTYAQTSLEERDASPGVVRERCVVLITGGLGGLGLVFAEHLARTARARIVLVGRTALPERSQWPVWTSQHGPQDRVRRAIEKIGVLEGLGGEVLYLRADVTNLDEMRAALDAARARFGAIHGVLHAAGVVRDGLIQGRTQSDSEDVFAPKIHGTHVLETLLGKTELDFLVHFSSTSVATAPPGQVDYVAANAFLNAQAEKRAQGGRTKTLAIGWGVWSEVGMAAEAVSRREAAPRTAIPLDRPRAHPLLDERIELGSGETLLAARYAPETHWVFGEHRTSTGQALLPGTGYLELAAAALEERGELGAFEIRDLYFFRPLLAPDGEALAVQIHLRPSEEGYDFEVRSEVRLPDGRRGWQSHAQARIRLHSVSPPGRQSLPEIRRRCGAQTPSAQEDGIRTAQEAHLRFGPRWRVLREIRFGAAEGLARVELQPAYHGDVERFRLHPAMLDLATSFALPLVRSDQEGLWVPVSYGLVRVHRPLPARVHSWAKVRDAGGGDFARFDVVITDDEGQVLVEIEEFSMKRIASPAELAHAPAVSLSEIEIDPAHEEASAGQASPAELALRRNVELGIRPAEGVACFDRILAASTPPVVVVSSLDLEALRRQSARIAAQSVPTGPRFERPKLSSDYLAPRDEIERTLAGFWEELLGVGSVGVRDSFFDLGGHSLIAVRLFARIKKVWHVEYPISVLFEAPTIERCAEMLRGAVAAGGAERNGSEGSQRSRYKHLVAMHPGQGGRRAPFFLVAGMFGNVLNLRHLAHLIGDERPIYGLQARGLYGDLAPHETFEEMAADYLAEIRTVQAAGPYLLGGFSGGGITAYEIASQLLATGERIEALVLLDTPLPQTQTLTARDKMLIHWQRLQRLGPAYVSEWTRDKIQWKLKRLRERGEPVPQASATDFHSDAIEAAFRRALGAYVMKALPVEVKLFRPKLDVAHKLPGGRVTNAYREFVLHDNGWSAYATDVEVHEVPGDHDSMVLEPNVRAMATKMHDVLRRYERGYAQVTTGR